MTDCPVNSGVHSRQGDIPLGCTRRLHDDPEHYWDLDGLPVSWRLQEGEVLISRRDDD